MAHCNLLYARIFRDKRENSFWFQEVPYDKGMSNKWRKTELPKKKLLLGEQFSFTGYLEVKLKGGG